MNPDYPKYNPKHKKHTISYVLVNDAGETKRFRPDHDKGTVTIHSYDKDGKLVDTQSYLAKAARGIWDNHTRAGYSRGKDIRNLPKHVDDYLIEYMEKSKEIIKDIYEDGDLLEMRIDPKEFYKKMCTEDYENYALNA